MCDWSFTQRTECQLLVRELGSLLLKKNCEKFPFRLSEDFIMVNHDMQVISTRITIYCSLVHSLLLLYFTFCHRQGIRITGRQILVKFPVFLVTCFCGHVHRSPVNFHDTSVVQIVKALENEGANTLVHRVPLTTSKKMQKKLLVVTELFNIAVNGYGAKKSTRYSRVLVVTELVISGTQCTLLQ